MRKTLYEKVPKTFQEQLELLKERGLIIPNEEKARRILQTISYHRLSAYWYPMLRLPKENEIFKENSSFENIFQLYKFDSQLRLLVFYAIEQIEVALRTQIIFQQSIKYKTGFWFLQAEIFDDYKSFITLQNILLKRTNETREEFITKYKSKYTNTMPPAWKILETISFRALNALYKHLKST